MNDLIERLQALAGPDEAIDIEIAERFTDWRDRGYPPPAYSASLDAALTLVPVVDRPRHGLWINLHSTLGSFGTHGCTWSAEIWGVMPIEGREPIDLKDFKYWGLHPLPAIALLIAIMKAREESK